jgi:hypothetical protein
MARAGFMLETVLNSGFRMLPLDRPKGLRNSTHLTGTPLRAMAMRVPMAPVILGIPNTVVALQRVTPSNFPASVAESRYRSR